jgi:hypothetical protein
MGHHSATQTKTAKVTPQKNAATSIGLSRPTRAPLHAILQIQRTIGNQAVQSLLRSGGPQAKFEDGQPEDIYAQEAGEFTETALPMRSPMLLMPADGSRPEIQRKCEECASGRGLCPTCAEEEEAVQRKPLAPGITPVIQRRVATEPKEALGTFQIAASHGHPPGAASGLETQLNAMRGGGQSLAPSTRAFMESRFGDDFSQVRIHSDSQASKAARALQAQAFTRGQDIFFATGQYQPDTPHGRQLLAHELTHTIQQRGRWPTSQARLVIDRPGDAYEREADHVAEMVLRQDHGQAVDSLAPAAGAPALQRQAMVATEAPSITEAEARALLDAEEQQDLAEVSPEETEALAGAEEGPPPGPIAEEAAATGVDEATEEVEIPEFDAGTGEECPKLVPDDLPEPAVGGTPPAGPQAESSEEGFFSKLLDFVPTWAVGGLVGVGASWIWRRLPLSVRAAAVNRGIDAAILVVENLPGRAIVGRVWGWIEAGLTAFLQRLRRLEDAEKVAIFEKLGSVLLGGNIRYLWGFAKGLLKGFFLDGLIGIIQMIVDLVCMVPKVVRFIESIGRFFTSLPEEIEAAYNAMRDLGAAINAAIRGAVDEVIGMLRDPQRLVGLLDTIYTAGQSMARDIGERIADAFIAFFRQSTERIGESLGRIVGQLVFEGALAFVTGGGGAAITGAKLAVRGAVRLLGQIGRRIFAVMRFIGELLVRVKDIVVRARRFLTRLLRTVADKLYQALEWILDFFHSFNRYCRPGSTRCLVPRRRRPRRPRSAKCRGRFVPRLGGFRPHDVYTARVTGRRSDFKITLGPILRCTYDAKIGRELVECKTGYGWLQNPTVQQQPWFPLALARLESQRYRCLVTAARCGYIYKWYMQNAGAAAYLAARWGGIPPVLHRP